MLFLMEGKFPMEQECSTFSGTPTYVWLNHCILGAFQVSTEKTPQATWARFEPTTSCYYRKYVTSDTYKCISNVHAQAIPLTITKEHYVNTPTHHMSQNPFFPVYTRFWWLSGVAQSRPIRSYFRKFRETIIMSEPIKTKKITFRVRLPLYMLQMSPMLTGKPVWNLFELDVRAVEIIHIVAGRHDYVTRTAQR